jgi:uncharacterized protein YbjT (DUF2867 family)
MQNVILMVGSTGMLGGMITRRLLEQGRQVRILVRPGSAYTPLVDAGAEPVFGDLKDRASLDAACRGVDTVLTTANSGFRSGEDTVDTVDRQGNRNLIDAAKAAGVQQFIFISTVLADAGSPVPVFQAKAETEAYLQTSGMPYTVVAPHSFLEMMPYQVVIRPVLAGEPVTLVGEGRRLHAYDSMQDAATLAAAAVGHPAAVNTRLILTGPVPVSWHDLVALVEQQVGRPVSVQSVTPMDPIPGMHEVVRQAMIGHEYFDMPLDTSETARAFGIMQTTPEEWVRRSLAEALTPA